MKIAKLAIGIAVLGTLPAGTVFAQAESHTLLQPASVERVAFRYDSYLSSAAEDQASESAGVPAVEAGSGAVCAEGCGCEREGCSCGYNDCGPCARWLAREPWKLPQPCLLQNMGINAGGWIQAGITANAEDPADRFNGPILMNDRDGEFQMHQVWLYFERPCQTDGYGVDVGGRVDLFYGTDFRFAVCQGQGFEDKINGLDQLYGFGLPQFYLEEASTSCRSRSAGWAASSGTR